MVGCVEFENFSFHLLLAVLIFSVYVSEFIIIYEFMYIGTLNFIFERLWNILNGSYVIW